MKNITILLALFLSVGVFSSHAQSTNWKSGNNEINVGIKPFKFGPTSIQYKTKLSQKNWLRMGITDLRIMDGSSGFRIGVEKQRNLIMRSRLIYGLEPGINFDYDRIDNNFSNYEVDLGIPVGVQIHLSKRLLIGFESRPSIGLYESSILNDSPERTNKIGGGIDLFNGIKTTLGYRF